LAEKLTALLDRTVDLLRIMRDHVAHPDFLGRLMHERPVCLNVVYKTGTWV